MPTRQQIITKPQRHCKVSAVIYYLAFARHLARMDIFNFWATEICYVDVSKTLFLKDHSLSYKSSYMQEIPDLKILSVKSHLYTET